MEVRLLGPVELAGDDGTVVAVPGQKLQLLLAALAAAPVGVHPAHGPAVDAPGHRLQPGDVVEMEVEGIGVLRSTIDPKVNDDPNYRYRAKEQPPLPEPGIAKDYRYELRMR